MEVVVLKGTLRIVVIVGPLIMVRIIIIQLHYRLTYLSILGSSRVRRSPRSPHSPNDRRYERYDRRSFSPSFRPQAQHREYPTSTTDSPIGYKTSLADSTISDTELERQQQFLQQEYYGNTMGYNHTGGLSPKRPNLDDRIHSLLSQTSPPQQSAQMQYSDVQNYSPYPMIHDNPIPGYYPDQHHQFNHHQQQQQQQHQQQHPHHRQHMQQHQQQPPRGGGFYNNHEPVNSMNNYNNNDYSNNYPTRNYVNNSNLVEITQQKRERSRVNSQIAVQVGNVLEIVPSTKMPMDEIAKSMTPDGSSSASPMKNQTTPNYSQRPPALEDIKLKMERRAQAKVRRKVERERKRSAKHQRKEKLKMEIQRYLNFGIKAEDSDDENLVELKPLNALAIADRSILKIKEIKSADKGGNKKAVIFSDGVMPGETSCSSNDDRDETERNKKIRMRRKKMSKMRKIKMIKERIGKENVSQLNVSTIPDASHENAPPPQAPLGSPSLQNEQPRLRVLTAEMFYTFPVNTVAINYFYAKFQNGMNQNSNNHHNHYPSPGTSTPLHHNHRRQNDRYNYSSQQYQQQQQQARDYNRSAIQNPNNSGMSLSG